MHLDVIAITDHDEIEGSLRARDLWARGRYRFDFVVGEEVTVTDLTDLLAISQPLVSWHLRKLRRAGLIGTRRAGRQVYCSLNMERFQECVQQLELLVDPATLLASLPAGEALIGTEVSLED